MKYFVIMIIALLIAAHPVSAQLTTADAADDSVVAQTFNDMNKGFKSLRGRIAKLEKEGAGGDVVKAIEAAALRQADQEALTTVGGDSTNILYSLYLQNRTTPAMKKAAVQKYMDKLVGGGGSDPKMAQFESELRTLRGRLDRLATKEDLEKVAEKAEGDLKRVAHAAGVAADGKENKEARQQAIQWLANR